MKPWSVREWTCEDCTDIMARLGAYMNQKDTVQEAVQLMQGQLHLRFHDWSIFRPATPYHRRRINTEKKIKSSLLFG